MTETWSGFCIEKEKPIQIDFQALEVTDSGQMTYESSDDNGEYKVTGQITDKHVTFKKAYSSYSFMFEGTLSDDGL